MENLQLYTFAVAITGFLILLVPFIFYVITLQNALKAVTPQCRQMVPGNVWLLFIPLFGFIWFFITVNAVAASFEKQYERYGMLKQKPSFGMGLATGILLLLGFLPVVNLAFLTCWIIHWVQVAKYKNELLRLNDTFKNAGETSIFADGI